MARDLTDDEKRILKGLFPQLQVDRVLVTAEATPVYNCIAWTLGITGSWVWPGSNLADFDALYARYGIKRIADGYIAVWGNSPADLLHGSIVGPVPYRLWESKLGKYLRILHEKEQLTSRDYGHIIQHYSKWAASDAAEREIELMNQRGPDMLSNAEQAEVGNVAGGVDPELAAQFDRKFEDWRATWSSPELAIHSNPAAFAQSKEFEELAAMGQEIVPLVVGKLAEPDNFLALTLYDRLMGMTDMVVQTVPDSEEAIEGEQGRALRTVRRYLSAMMA